MWEQLVLLADGPHGGKAEALAQPRHRLEGADRAAGGVEGAEAAYPWHRLLDQVVVARDPCLRALGHVVRRCSWRQTLRPALGNGLTTSCSTTIPKRLCAKAKAADPLIGCSFGTEHQTDYNFRGVSQSRA